MGYRRPDLEEALAITGLAASIFAILQIIAS